MTSSPKLGTAEGKQQYKMRTTKGLQTRHPQEGLRGQWSVLTGLWG